MSNILEVGDTFFTISNNIPISYDKIDRVTAKYAFCNKIKFHRALNGNALICVEHGSIWNRNRYELPTEELIQAYNRLVRIRKIQQVDWDSLTDDQILRIWTIVKENKCL